VNGDLYSSAASITPCSARGLEVLEARPAEVAVGAAAAFAETVLALGEHAPFDEPFELSGFALGERVQIV
jgi:hypothetical protein